MNYDSRYLSFDVPTVWRKPRFCLTKIVQRRRHRTVNYSVVHCFTEPMSHSKSFPIRVCPTHSHPQSEISEPSDGDFDLRKKIVPLSQSEMNDWIRNLDLPKDKADILTSRKKERKPLHSGL